jgi:TolA-binding protein
MFIEAYNMAAQAQQFFPVSALFRILNLDGKDKVLPVIEENEHYQEQMQQLQQQVEQMSQQMEQMQAENMSLKQTANELTNSLATVGSRPSTPSGGMTQPSDSPNAIVDAARSTLGVPTGMELPT